MMDASRFAKEFPDVPLIGFYAGGEADWPAVARRRGRCVYRTGDTQFQIYLLCSVYLPYPSVIKI